MALSEFIFENLRWKLAALVVAVFVWFSIQLAIWRSSNEGPAQVLRHQRVGVLTTPGDPRTFRIEPPEVDLVVSSLVSDVKPPSDSRIQILVDLTEFPDVTELIREVLVRTPEGIKALRTDPRAVSVFVERTNEPGLFQLKSVTKP